MLTRDEILARKTIGAEPFDLPDGSGTVMVRGLTRREALEATEISVLYDRDAYMISCGLVEPALSPDDVKAWGDGEGTALLEALSRKIGALSGMVEGAGKSGVSRTRPRRRS